MRISRDDMFLQIVSVVAKRSTCLRGGVGALVVRDGRIVSMGYNGPVSGMPECVGRPNDSIAGDGRLAWYHACEGDYGCQGPGCTRSLHAETNAIAFAAKAGVSVDGCTLYCSMSPCINCAKVIVNSGISEVVYGEQYRDDSGLWLLKKAGVHVRSVVNAVRSYRPVRVVTEEEKRTLLGLGKKLADASREEER